MSYDNLATVHQLAAYVWFGSLLGTLMFTYLASRRSPDGLVLGAAKIVRISTLIGLPAALVLLIAGFWMMGIAGLNYGSAWVSIGFVAWLLAALVGSGLQHPAARRMRNAGLGSPEALRMARRIILICAVQIAVIIVAVWVMGAQPGG